MIALKRCNTMYASLKIYDRQIQVFFNLAHPVWQCERLKHIKYAYIKYSVHPQL